MKFVNDVHHTNQDGMRTHFVALLCKGMSQSIMLFGCSCQLLLWSRVITIFDLGYLYGCQQSYLWDVHLVEVIYYDCIRPEWHLARSTGQHIRLEEPLHSNATKCVCIPVYGTIQGVLGTTCTL